MKKIEFNRETLEQEGYTLRVEDGITYIEKEEKTNNSKYGECFSFFQQKIELDKKGKEIVTQTDRLYKKIEDKEQNLESNELIFEGEDLVLKSMTTYLEKDGSMYYKEVQNFIDKKETIIFFQETDQLKIKSIGISNIGDKFCDLYTEYDEKGLIIREEKLIKIENIDEEKLIVTIEQKIKENIENIERIENIESTYINNKRTYSRWLDEKGNMTAELKINGEVKEWIYYDSDKNIKLTTRIDLTNNMEYTNKYKQVNGKLVLIKTMNGKIDEEPTFIAEYTSRGVQTYLSYIEGDVKKSIYNDENGKLTKEIEENKESKIEKTTYYQKSGLISVVIEEDKESKIEKTTNYDKSGNIRTIREENKESGTEKTTNYNESGGISFVTEKDKESGIKKTTHYSESGGISFVTEEDKESGIEKNTYYSRLGSIINVSEIDRNTGNLTNIYYYYTDNKEKNLDFKIITINDKIGRTKDKRYSKTTDEITTEYIDNKLYPKVKGESKYITLRTIEDLGEGNKKITEGNTITYQYQNETIINTYRSLEEDSRGTICDKIIEREKERVVVQFNLEGKWTSILRTIKNSPVPIEEFYKKGDSLPTFKVEGFEIPLDNLDKYKDICQKYNITCLFEVLEAHEPKNPIQSTIKSFVDFLKR